MTKWVRALIVANVAMYVLQLWNPGLTGSLELLPAIAFQRPWTLFTYMFLHGSIGHILFNMLSLYFFGPRLETVMGGARFITLYVLAGLGGAALSFLPMSYGVPIIGASGAVVGVVTAYARLWPKDRIYIYGVIPLEARWYVGLFSLASILGAFGIYIPVLVDPQIAHLAHLGGVVVGWAYMSWLRNQTGAARFKKTAVAAPVASDGDAQKRWGAIRIDDLHPINRGEVVRLLQKVQTSGARSLSPEERATLDRFSLTS